ncbi:methionine-R-sulfoxide reductase B1-A-like isoform X3 [Oratosquilla oratoria]|uniref:methionine-R-sulfoxide reductase B1-A-like isoform X3 n=1 Tax=Oratosquilla oratoria TaxID=337810 RepID=UPI003F764F83
MAFCAWTKTEKYRDHFEPGVYLCRRCDSELFSSNEKYQHSSPWPAFMNTINNSSVHKFKQSTNAYKNCNVMPGSAVHYSARCETRVRKFWQAAGSIPAS